MLATTIAESLPKPSWLATPGTLPCTNCGMAPLPRAVAGGKLRALGQGAALVRRELGAWAVAGSGA